MRTAWCVYFLSLLSICTAQDSSGVDEGGSAEQSCTVTDGAKERHYEYLDNVLTSSTCTISKRCNTRQVNESCDDISDGDHLISNAWNEECTGSTIVPGSAEIRILLASPRQISTVRLTARRCIAGIDEVYITSTTRTAERILLRPEPPGQELTVIGEIFPPIMDASFTINFSAPTPPCDGALRIAEFELYALPVDVINILHHTDVVSDPSCGLPNAQIESTCGLSDIVDEDCRCAIQDIIWDSSTPVVNRSWTFTETTFAFTLRLQDMELLYSRIELVPLHCASFQVEYTCASEVMDPCEADTVISVENDLRDESSTASLGWVNMLKELSGVKKMCLRLKCQSASGSTTLPLIRVLRLEIFGKRTTHTTTQQVPSTTIPDDTTTQETSTRAETTAEELTTEEPGLIVDCKMKLVMTFEEAFSVVGSDAYQGLIDSVRPPIDGSFVEIYGPAFISSEGWRFSEGSVDTKYTANLGQGSTLTSDQQDQLKTTIIDALDSYNITVDPSSLDFTPKTDQTAAPPSADTEQLLLAGVMGAVVTLLVIALAIAAVAVRLCINRRRRDERRGNDFDDLHRDSNPMRHYNGYYPGTMPPPYPRNGSVSTQSQHSSVPAYFTSSLPRYGRYPFQAPPPQPGHPRRAGSDRDAFEFPTPMVANEISTRRSESDFSEDSRGGRAGRRHSSLTGYVPRHTQIPRVAPSHRQQNREYSTHAHGNHRRTNRSHDYEPSLHRNGTGLSTEDLIFGQSRPRLTRQDTNDSGNRPRLRRLPSNYESEGNDSRGRSNDAYEDDAALRPYYLTSDEPVQESSGIFDRLSRTFPVSREEEPDKLHRQVPSYMKSNKKNKTRKDSSNSRI